MMMTTEDVRKMILAKMPDAEVTVGDLTGTSDHFDIIVLSKAFAGKSLIDQHKMVFEILKPEMDRGIHAVQLKTRAINN